MDIDDKERRSLLRDEYLLLQNQYESFDARALTIKGWAGAGAVTALALAVTSDSPVRILIPLITAIVAAVIWYHEAYWKLFQYALRERIQAIEGYFRGATDPAAAELAPFQAYASWFLAYQAKPEESRRRFWRAARQRFVATLYLAIISVSAISFALIAVQMIFWSGKAP